MAELNTITQQATTRAKDAAYVLVGLGVLGAQRVAVSGQELRSRSRPATSTSAWPESVRRSPATTPRSSSWPRSGQRIEDAFVRLETDHEAVETSCRRTRVRHQRPQPARDLRASARPGRTL